MSRKQIGSVIFLFCGMLIIVCLICIVWGTLRDRQLPARFHANVRTLADFTYKLENGEHGRIHLPYSFKNLPLRTPITLYTDIVAKPGEALLVKTIYTPLRLYADDKLIYACGQEGSYPDFLLDPPTIIMTVPLPEKNGPQQLRFEYLSPTQRNMLKLPTTLVGQEMTLLVYLFKQNGFLFLFSLIHIFIGVVMVSITLILTRVESSIMPFLWLGLFSVSTGIWSFGECDLTAFFIPYPSLLYIMAFTGLFVMTIPLLRFGFLLLNLHNKQPLEGMLLLLTMLVASALVLQLTGLVALSRSMYVFHVVVPLAFILFAVCIVWDYIRYQNVRAQHFVLPMLVLAISTVLELINYQFHFINILSFFVQTGVSFFILSLSVMGGYYTREALLTTEERKRLNVELALMERQLDAQKMQYTLLTENAEAVKAQRHDLRHQLAVIKYYNDSNKSIELDNYVSELLTKIPIDKETFLCENVAVNAVVLYYLFIAKSQGIEVSIKLMISADCGRVQDSDLCIIVGNFFENAIEACKQVMTNEKYIKMYSRIQYDTLILAMDNSFDGIFEQKDGAFLSRKRNDQGIGLASVQAVAKRYDGSAKFEARGNEFKASVYVKM